MSTQTSSGYMHVQLDQYGRVDELVALSTQPLTAAPNYLQLYHVHEKYLNNLVQRWQDGLIEDFYVYFKEPWACAIFHDRFADLVEEINEDVQSTPLQVIPSMNHSYATQSSCNGQLTVIFSVKY